jgi:hypothetical protein
VEETVGAVHTDRPEGVDRDVTSYSEPVDGLAIVLGRDDGQIE